MDELMSLLVAACNMSVTIKEVHVTPKLYEELCKHGEYTDPPPILIRINSHSIDVYPQQEGKLS